LENVNESEIAVDLKPLVFADFCESLVGDLGRDHPPSPRITYSFDPTHKETVHIDEQLVKNILDILLKNACQYSPEETPITVDFAFSTDSDAPLTIQVSDQGYGIAPEEIDIIFELFYRGKNVENLKSGLGSGLFKAQFLAQAMGGRISAGSDGINQGTTFTLTLPSHP